jgi:hypothetical protein
MEKKNVFISHHHEDATKIADLINLIEKSGRYRARDSSIYEDKTPNKATNSEYIKTLLRPQIDWAGTVIVIIGEKTKQSEWVNWEIEYAGRKDKNIIGIFLPGIENDKIPDSLAKNCTDIIRWRSNNLDKALEGERIFENPVDGYRDKPFSLRKEVVC